MHLPSWKIAMCVGGSAALSGCAAVSAMQKPVVAADVRPDAATCPSDTDIQNPLNAGPLAGVYRDQVITRCIKAIDRHYAEFKASLHRESSVSNLVTDIASLGLSGGASVASGGVARGLSAGSAFVSGSGKSINKDVFFDMTLPAIESSMDAGRSKVLQGIIDAQRTDQTGKKYTLSRAGYDIDAYDGAGNLYIAISELTKAATVNAQDAQADVARSQRGFLELKDVEILPGDVTTRLGVLTSLVEPLTDENKINSLVSLLVPALPANYTMDQKKDAIMVEMEKRVMMNDPIKDAEAMTDLENKVKPILGN